MFTSKKFWIWIILIVVVGGGLFYYFRPKPEPLEFEEVRRGDVVETISVSGEIIPSSYADLSFQQIGTITDVFVVDGEEVAKGDPLAKINSPTLAAQIHEAEVALETALQTEALARRDWDSLKPEEKAAKKLATDQARAALATIKAQSTTTVLRAPFAGTITNVEARVGETGTAGVTQMRLATGSDLEVEARIPESDIAELQTGMTGTITFDALRQDEIFQAEIKKIDQGATINDGVVSYRVTFGLKTVDERLRDGMTANIDIESAKSESVLILSYRALERDGDEYFVNVVGPDGLTTERRRVVIGLEGDEGEVEVREGLQGGEKVTIGAKQKD